jgi:prepilin-type N-terminal cleavage/methylation domain-containing protein
MRRLPQTNAGFSLPELMITVAISAIAIVAAGNFINNFMVTKAEVDAAANVEREIDGFEKILRKRWAQRERPISPVTDMPGEFTSLHPGFLWNPTPAAYNCDRNAISFQPACYSWAVTGCPTSSNCRQISVLASMIDGSDQRSATWLGINNECRDYPALARFDYTQGTNPCRCANSPANRRLVNQVVFNDFTGRQLRFPQNPSDQIGTMAHSFSACFSWNPPDLNINFNVTIELEAAYRGQGNRIKFVRKRISLPIKAAHESSDSIRR